MEIYPESVLVQIVRYSDVHEPNKTQVVLGFLLTAGITILMLLIYYIFAYDPSLNPFRNQDSLDKNFQPNPVDVALLKCTTRLRSLCGTSNYDGSEIEEAFNKVRSPSIDISNTAYQMQVRPDSS